MRPAYFLQSLTRTPCPGRFAVLTEPLDGLTDEVQRRDRAFRQAQGLIDYCCEIHELSRKRLTAAFGEMLEAYKGRAEVSDGFGLPERIFDYIKNACYPYIYLPEQEIRDNLVRQQKSWEPKPLLLTPVDHVTTLAEPDVLYRYYVEQCADLLFRGFRLEAGLSVVPMPVTFAIENVDIDIPARKDVLESIQNLFPAVSPCDIDDSIVDGDHRAQDESMAINRDYGLFSSLYWHRYSEYLSTPEPLVVSEKSWRTDMANADPGTLSEETRSRLLDARNRVAGPTAGNFIQPHGAETERWVAPRAKPDDVLFRPPRPLSFFDAPRTHYALSRINHYTNTNPKYFQKTVLLVNFREYARQFVLRALVEIHRIENLPNTARSTTVSDDYARLIVSAHDFHDGGAVSEGGRIIRHADLAEMFSLGPDDPKGIKGLERLTVLDKALRERRNLEDEDDEAHQTYRQVKQIIEDNKLVGGSTARMPAYHYIPPTFVEDDADQAALNNKSTSDQSKDLFDLLALPGISMVDFGVGASNAKAITDILAPLRPHCWFLLSRCGGLRKQQHIGDYVLATSFVRRDGVLDAQVPRDAPVKTSRFVLRAFEKATTYNIAFDKKLMQRMESERSSWPWSANLSRARAQGASDGYSESKDKEIKFHEARREVLRLGTVYSINDRHWTTQPMRERLEEFNAYRCIAIDMESGTVAANGFRYRIQHGAFLCVSEKALEGSVRMRQHRNGFFSRQSARHLTTAIDAIRWLVYHPSEKREFILSRELRGTDDPPWM